MSQATGDAKPDPGDRAAPGEGDLGRGGTDPSAGLAADAAGEASISEAAVMRALEQRGTFLALCVVLLGLAVRLAGFTDWWVNPDEGIYFSTVTSVQWEDFWREVRISAHPPLYFLLMRGVGWFTTDFAAFRMVALVSGCAAIFAFILVGREVGGGGGRGWLAGLAAGLLLALSPRAIILSQIIRPYMLLVLVLSAALYALLRYRRDPRLRFLLLYATCTTTAALLHYSAVLAFGVLGGLVLAWGRGSTDSLDAGFRGRAWWRLLAAQIPAVVTVAALYLLHLRNLMSLQGAENATEGWLGQFMIRHPGDVWLALVGFHAMLAGEGHAAALALVTLAALVLAMRRRAWTPSLVAAAALAVATAAASARMYPFGATRHAAWLLVFVVPLLGWLAAVLVRGALVPASRRSALAGLAALAVLGLVGRPLGTVLGAGASPMEISEHVLQRGHLNAMTDVLDPNSPPPVILMSTETYSLLLPLYIQERERQRTSPDGVLVHFRWGDRDVVVLPTRDFTALPSQVGFPNHLHTVLERAAEAFPETAVPGAETVLVLAGGWRSQGMADLAVMAREGASLGDQVSVPGLIAVTLDVAAYRQALDLEETAGGAG